jgi:hypothetical protein
MGPTLNHNRVSAAVGFSKDFNDKHHAKGSRSWSRQKVIWAFSDRENHPARKTGRQYSSSAKQRPRCEIGPLFVNGFRGERKRNMQRARKGTRELEGDLSMTRWSDTAAFWGALQRFFRKEASAWGCARVHAIMRPSEMAALARSDICVPVAKPADRPSISVLARMPRPRRRRYRSHGRDFPWPTLTRRVHKMPRRTDK